MKDSLVIGAVIAVFLIGSGQTYSNKCDDSTIAAIKEQQEPGFESSKIPSKLYQYGEKIVATTTNYFDPMLTHIEGSKFFRCAYSFWDIFDGKYTVTVEFHQINGDKKKKTSDGAMFSGLKVVEDGGLTFAKCYHCPKIIETAKAYRFFEKGCVVGVYTCNTGDDAAVGRREGFIKVKEGLIVDSKTKPRVPTIPDDTKTLINEAKKKAKSLGLRIRDVSFDCHITPPDNPPPSQGETSHKRHSHSSSSQGETSHKKHSHNSHPPSNDEPTRDNLSTGELEDAFSKRKFGKYILIAAIPIAAALGLTTLFFAIV